MEPVIFDKFVIFQLHKRKMKMPVRVKCIVRSEKLVETLLKKKAPQELQYFYFDFNDRYAEPNFDAEYAKDYDPDKPRIYKGIMSKGIYDSLADANNFIQNHRISFPKCKEFKSNVNSEVELSNIFKKEEAADALKKKKKEIAIKKIAASKNSSYILASLPKLANSKKTLARKSQRNLPSGRNEQSSSESNDQSSSSDDLDVVHQSSDEESSTAPSGPIDASTKKQRKSQRNLPAKKVKKLVVHHSSDEELSTAPSGPNEQSWSESNDRSSSSDGLDVVKASDSKYNGAPSSDGLNVRRTIIKAPDAPVEPLMSSKEKLLQAKINRLEMQKNVLKSRCDKAERVAEDVGQHNLLLQRKMINCQCSFGASPPPIIPTEAPENVPIDVELTPTQEALLSRFLTPKLELTKFIADLAEMVYGKSAIANNTASKLDPMKMQFVIDYTRRMTGENVPKTVFTSTINKKGSNLRRASIGSPNTSKKKKLEADAGITEIEPPKDGEVNAGIQMQQEAIVNEMQQKAIDNQGDEIQHQATTMGDIDGSISFETLLQFDE